MANKEIHQQAHAAAIRVVLDSSLIARKKKGEDQKLTNILAQEFALMSRQPDGVLIEWFDIQLGLWDYLNLDSDGMRNIVNQVMARLIEESK